MILNKQEPAVKEHKFYFQGKEIETVPIFRIDIHSLQAKNIKASRIFRKRRQKQKHGLQFK